MPPSKQPESPKPAADPPPTSATAPGGGVAPPSPPEPSPPSCPICDGVIEVYAGPNLHKRGTGWCIICGRVTL